MEERRCDSMDIELGGDEGYGVIPTTSSSSSSSSSVVFWAKNLNDL